MALSDRTFDRAIDAQIISSIASYLPSSSYPAVNISSPVVVAVAAPVAEAAPAAEAWPTSAPVAVAVPVAEAAPAAAHIRICDYPGGFL